MRHLPAPAELRGTTLPLPGRRTQWAEKGSSGPVPSLEAEVRGRGHSRRLGPALRGSQPLCLSISSLSWVRMPSVCHLEPVPTEQSRS